MPCATWQLMERRRRTYEVSLSGASWGIKAVWERASSCNNLFRYPLLVQEVGLNSAAFAGGIRVGDEIVGLAMDGEYTPVTKFEAPNGVLYVNEAFSARVMKGGDCTLRVCRSGDRITCGECGCGDLLEEEREGDLVCTRCGVVARERLAGYQRLASKGREWESDAYWQILHICSQFELPQLVFEVAYNSFKEVVQKNAGIRRRTSFMLASVFVSCTQCSAPRTFQEFAALGTCCPRELRRCIRFIEEMRGSQCVTHAVDLLPRFLSRLELSPDVEKSATSIAELATRYLPGKLSTTLAAASIEAACVLRKKGSQADAISAATGVSKLTILNTSKLVLRNAHLSKR
jgi:hypothetical protein